MSNKLKGKAKANARKKAQKSTNRAPRVNIIDGNFKTNCHNLFHTMVADSTIDFSKAPYDVWLHGPAFHNGKAIDRDKVDTITCITPGQAQSPRLDPIKMTVKTDGVNFATRHQTYVMNVEVA
tara:strand:- start:501 stop:869 length:369 start_codon:yes stop_codon:yes gene_type:complete